MRSRICLALISLFSFTSAIADVPGLLPFQAVIRDNNGDIIADNTVVEFSIWDAQEGGTRLWGPEQIAVQPVNGVVSVMLGETLPLHASHFEDASTAYLSLTIGIEELSRIPLGTACFALRASDAESVGGRSPSEFADSVHEHDASDITTGTISSELLEEGAVTTSKLADGAVTSEKIDAGGTEGQALMILEGGTVGWDEPPVGGGGVSSVTAADGGGLEAGGTASDVELSIADGGVTSTKINPGGTEGQVLMIEGSDVVWKLPPVGGGGVSSVTAADGGGLATSGTAQDVELSIAVDGVTSDMIQDGTIVDIDISSSAAISRSKIEGTAVVEADDAGRQGAASALYEGDTPISELYVGEGEPDAITTEMIVDDAVTAEHVGPDIVSSVDGVSNDGGDINFVAAGGGITITPDDLQNEITFTVTGGGGEGDVESVSGGNGLTATNPEGPDVTLNVVPGTGIEVSADEVGFDTTWGDGQYVNEGQTAGGDLTGTYPNPSIGSGKVVKSLNSIEDDVTIQGSGIINVSEAGQTITIGADAADDGDWTISGDDVYRSSGNVGLGISNPNWPLHIHKTGDGWSRIQLTSDATGSGSQSGIRLGVHQTGQAALNFSTSYFGLAAGGTIHWVFDDDGDFGIGVGTNPTSKFHVNGTARVGGFRMTTGADEGLVLTSDSNGNGTWEPMHVIDRHSEGTPTEIGTDITQFDNAQVTIEAPGPGYIVVTSTVWVMLRHTNGTRDWLEINHTTDLSNMDNIYTAAHESIPASYPTATNRIPKTLSVHSTHEVISAGSHTYYLVGRMNQGQDSGDEFYRGQMTAVFYPDPSVSLRAQQDEATSEEIERSGGK